MNQIEGYLDCTINATATAVQEDGEGGQFVETFDISGTPYLGVDIPMDLGDIGNDGEIWYYLPTLDEIEWDDVNFFYDGIRTPYDSIIIALKTFEPVRATSNTVQI